MNMRDIFLSGMIGLLAAAPASTNYILRNYDIGSGGTSSSSSTNYRLNGVSGTQTGAPLTSTNYVVESGLNNSQTVNVPLAPTFTNPSSYYNRLALTINKGTDPSDTKYLIAISTDNFVTTRYIQTDNTVGNTGALANYQLYTAWGGATGIIITGLTPSTSYQVKLKAIQGGFTNSGFGPTATAATVATSLTVSLATTSTGTPPFPVNFTSLTPGTVVSGTADAIIGVSTNAQSGGEVYIKSNNAGLASVLAGSSIASATADLNSAQSGYGAQVISVSQSSGGPLTSLAPFASTGNTVGGLTSSLQKILLTSGPITTASATIRLKAKASNITPSSSDYRDQLTLVAAMNF